MGLLLEAISTKDRKKAAEWARSEHWATVEQLISASSSPTSSNRSNLFGHNNTGPPSEASASIDFGPNNQQRTDQSLWTCPYCTFLNPAELNTCDMCSLPRYIRSF